MLPVLETTAETVVSEREIPQCNVSKVKARSWNEKRAGDEIKVKFSASLADTAGQQPMRAAECCSTAL
jgi:hypothetical protein